jgi:cell division protein FtsI (penicillin-binding protein 3)
MPTSATSDGRTLRRSRTERSASRSTGSTRALRPGVSVRTKTKRSSRRRSSRRRRPVRIPLAHTPRRLHVVLVIIAISLSLCAGRLVQLQGFDSSAYAAVSAEALVRTMPLLPSRGELTDRNGVQLAATEPAVAVTADPSLTRARAAEFAEVAARHLQVPAASLFPLLTKPPPSRFVYLKKKVPAMTYTRLATDLAERNLYGIFRESDPIRTYPGRATAGALIGFVSAEGKGQAGIEQKLNPSLAGVEGREVYESSPSGGKIPLGSSTVIPAQHGLNYQLSIDSELQWVAEQRIARQVASTRADHGFVITMNVKTGEILALAQTPTVDSSRPAATDEERRGVPAVSEPYEPGSVQKLLTAAALVDSGSADVETRVVVPNRLRTDGRALKDHWEHGELKLNLRGVVAYSSNIGMVLLSRQMPKAQLVDYLGSFGLGRKTGIELPAESSGILPGRELQNLTRDQMAFGQSIAVTGVQEVAALAGLLNGGIYNPPTLLKAATTSDGVAAPLAPRTPRRIVSGETSMTVRDLMQAVVDTENGRNNLSLTGYQSGGKTGTAQRADPNCGCYKGYVTSYVGYAPLNDPQLITYVVLNNPKKGDTGTGVAGPVFKDLMHFALPRYSVPPTGKQSKPKPTKWDDE